MDPFSCEKHSVRHLYHSFDRTILDPHTLDEKDHRVSAIEEPLELDYLRQILPNRKEGDEEHNDDDPIDKVQKENRNPKPTLSGKSEDSQFFPLLLPLDLSLDLPFANSLPLFLEDLPPFPPLPLGGCAGFGGR